MSRKFNEVLARNLRSWLAKLLPQHTEVLNGPGSFADVMRSGVILCELANYYKPGSIGARQICRDPNQAFRQRENVGFFLAAVRGLGIEDLYIFVTVDLYEEKNLPKVCDCILEIQKKYDPAAYTDALTQAKQGSSMINTTEASVAPEIKKAEQPKVYDRGVIKKLDGMTTMVEDEELKKKLKYSAELAFACKSWIEGVLETKAPEGVDLEAWLKDGVVFCRLVNKIRPGSVLPKNIYSGTISHRQMENLNFYLKAISEFGVASSDLFDVADLYEAKNFNMVLTHVNALANLCEAKKDWKGPIIANTSQAKNLLKDALLGGEIKIDESIKDNFSDEERDLVDWANSLLLKAQVSPINNWESLRSGIKIIKLLWGFLPSLETSGLQMVKQPKTLIDFMINATYIRMNITVNVREQELASGDKNAYIKILNFLREQNDFEWRFNQFCETIELEYENEEFDFIEETEEHYETLVEIYEPEPLPEPVPEPKTEPTSPPKTTSRVKNPSTPSIPSTTALDLKKKSDGSSEGKDKRTSSDGSKTPSSGKARGSSSRHHDKPKKTSDKADKVSTPKGDGKHSTKVSGSDSPKPKKVSDKKDDPSTPKKDKKTDNTESPEKKSSDGLSTPKAEKRSSRKVEGLSASSDKKSNRSSKKLDTVSESLTPVVSPTKVVTETKPVDPNAFPLPKAPGRNESVGILPKGLATLPRAVQVKPPGTPTTPTSPTVTPGSPTTPGSPGMPSRPSNPCIAKPPERAASLRPGISREMSTRNPLDEAKKKALAAKMMCSHIAKEISSTEKTYSDSLNTVVQKFLEPVELESLLGQTEVEDVFSNLKQISNFHKKFVTVIDDQLKQQQLGNNIITDSVLFGIANSFRENLDNFRMYEQYLTNFPTSNFCLTFYRERSTPLEEAFKTCVNDLGGLTVADILIMPVQRLPRYIMLLNTLQKYTPQGTLNTLLGSVQTNLQNSLLEMNSKIDPEKLASYQLGLKKQNEILNWKKPHEIKIKRKLLISSLLKIKDISDPSKKTFAKKTTKFTLFSDLLVISSLPKKSILGGFSSGANEEEPSLKFLDAGDFSDVIKVDAKTFKVSTMSADQFNPTKWTVETNNAAECEKWLSLLGK